ncbi:unnamed protein product (mitochondrion) [Plasmodiophora brassicae]|uniref:Uncharacterized protein n=1 Tax=Plasmodiophora brassicae TaxID=37360 RepID=A0A3P3YEU8_PLABS|nr:unnamed protein product [Plasmodiophora brassicae]
MVDASRAPQVIEHASVSLGLTPYDARWVPFSARLVMMGMMPRGTGVLRVYQFNRGDLQTTSEVEFPNGFKCGTFGASHAEQRTLATGDFGGHLCTWDVDTLSASSRPVFKAGNAHQGLVNCIDGIGGLCQGHGAPELVTGGRDGAVRVWDVRQAQPVASLVPNAASQARDCWTVAFGGSYNDDERCVCAGYDNGDIKLLDLRANKVRWETNIKNGVVSMQFDRADIPMNKLVVTTLESRFRVYDMRTMNSDAGYAFLSEKAHNSTVWIARHLPQNRDLFATGGGNGTLNLYQYAYPEKRRIKNEFGQDQGVAGTVTCLNKRKVADQPIVSLDWNASKLGLSVLTALDQTMKIVIVTKLDQF